MLQLDVYSKATDQNFDCGCDCCAILRLDSLYYSSLRSGCIISGYKHKLPSAPQRVVHFSPASWESGDEANLGVFVSTYLCRQESELALQLPLDRV